MPEKQAVPEKVFALSNQDGSFYQSGDTYGVRFERILDHPVQRVWAALTQPDRLAAWLAPTTIKGKAGGSIAVETFGGTMGGKILHWKENSILEYEWYKESIVRWELLTEGRGRCRLIFTVRLAPKSQLQGAATGWHYHLDMLAINVSGDEMPYFRIEDWEKISGAVSLRYKTQLQERDRQDFAERPPFVIERTFNAPVSRVWAALIDKEEIKRWSFTIASFEPVVGYEFTFWGGTETNGYTHLCQITEVIPERKLAYSWRYENIIGITHVSFELFPEGSKTRLRLTHEGLEKLAHAGPDFARTNFMAGWTSILDQGLAPLFGN
jgi:uncharacterized protein YndB with AHSA1/START domain